MLDISVNTPILTMPSVYCALAELFTMAAAMTITRTIVFMPYLAPASAGTLSVFPVCVKRLAAAFFGIFSDIAHLTDDVCSRTKPTLRFRAAESCGADHKAQAAKRCASSV